MMGLPSSEVWRVCPKRVQWVQKWGKLFILVEKLSHSYFPWGSNIEVGLRGSPLQVSCEVGVVEPFNTRVKAYK